MNQKQQLVQYLLKRRKRGISQFEADLLLGIARVSERIRELEREAFVFHREWERKTGRFRQVRYKRYWLISVPKAEK